MNCTGCQSKPSAYQTTIERFFPERESHIHGERCPFPWEIQHVYGKLLDGVGAPKSSESLERNTRCTRYKLEQLQFLLVGGFLNHLPEPSDHLAVGMVTCEKHRQ